MSLGFGSRSFVLLFRFCGVRFCRGAGLCRIFRRVEQSIYARQILAGLAKARNTFGLPGRKLEAQAKNLLSELAPLMVELIAAHLIEFLNGPRHYNPPARVMNCVRIGSLCEASFMASVADAKSTPDISNMMRPGLTTATQCSGGPLPLPIRVSAGFLVKGLSGKKRIQRFPPRLMKRVMATRAASI